MKKLLLFIIPLLLLIGCDTRTPDYADLQFSIDQEIAYNRVNYNEFTLSVKLQGDDSQVEYKYIYFVYDHTAAAFFGGATNSEVQTDEYGNANVTMYITDPNYRGDFVIEATYEDQSITKSILVQDVPDITSLVANPTNIPADGYSQSSITIQLASLSDNLENQRIHFTTTTGSIVPNEILTDEFGMGEVRFIAPETYTIATIRAELDICDDETRGVQVICE